MSSRISRHVVAQIWLRRGIEDLYFSFRTDFDQLQDYSTFVMIMGLEKHLKAVLLYHAHAEYETLDRQGARNKVDRIARRWRHHFLDMIREIDNKQWAPLNHILERQHHAWTGEQLVKVIEAGYEETRYPVARESWRDFPAAQDSTTYHDPLGSSDVDGLIREVCSQCLSHLADRTDIAPALRRVHDRHHDQESFTRFKNVYYGKHWSSLGL